MKALRIGLCLLLAFSVLAIGAVQVWSKSLLEIGAALLFLFWAGLAYRSLDAKVQWNPLNWPLLGFIGIGLLQLLFHGTAYAFLTRIELLKLAAYFLFFFLMTQAFRTRADLSFLAWFLILFCFAVSLLAIIQHFTSGGEIYWIRSLKVEGDPFGPYVNRNHFAGFVELTAPVGLALMAFRGVRRDLFPLTTLLTIVPVSAIVLTGSRGGIVSFAFEIAILALLVRNQRALHGGRVAVVALVAVVTLLLISWVGASVAIEKFSTLSNHDTSLSRRASMFRGAAHIFFDHPIKGCGLGTLIEVYPRYETAYDGRVVEHVHNDYIETLAETGLLGGLFGVIFLRTLYREARKNFTAEQAHFSQGLHAGAIVAIGGLLLHSFVDFNLQVPANAMLFLLQAYLATSPPFASRSSQPAQQRDAP
jgi:O-antigen ligase